MNELKCLTFLQGSYSQLANNRNAMAKISWSHKNKRAIVRRRFTDDLTMKNIIWILLMAAAIALRAAEAAPTNSPATNAPAAKNEAATIPDATHKPVFTTNTIIIAGQRVKYLAETGMLPILKADGSTSASVFYIAYTRLGETNTSARPVTFCFNGGPGSSSVWLHLGALGPRRVKMGEEGEAVNAPYELIDNPESWLPFTDLVFIDPVGTGFSRSLKQEDEKSFWGLKGDVDS